MTAVKTACNEKGSPADGMIAARSPIGTPARRAGSSKAFLQFGTLLVCDARHRPKIAREHVVNGGSGRTGGVFSQLAVQGLLAIGGGLENLSAAV